MSARSHDFGGRETGDREERRGLTRSSTSKNADDIVIVYAARTPLCKAKKGGLKDTSLEYMIYALLKQVKERSGVDPALVEDICVGNVRVPAVDFPTVY